MGQIRTRVGSMQLTSVRLRPASGMYVQKNLPWPCWLQKQSATKLASHKDSPLAAPCPTPSYNVTSEQWTTLSWVPEETEYPTDWGMASVNQNVAEPLDLSSHKLQWVYYLNNFEYVMFFNTLYFSMCYLWPRESIGITVVSNSVRKQAMFLL